MRFHDCALLICKISDFILALALIRDQALIIKRTGSRHFNYQTLRAALSQVGRLCNTIYRHP